MDCLPHSNDILVDTSATCGDHALDTLVLAELLDDQGRLHGKFSHGN